MRVIAVEVQDKTSGYKFNSYIASMDSREKLHYYGLSDDDIQYYFLENEWDGDSLETDEFIYKELERSL